MNLSMLFQRAKAKALHQTGCVDTRKSSHRLFDLAVGATAKGNPQLVGLHSHGSSPMAGWLSE